MSVEINPLMTYPEMLNSMILRAKTLLAEWDNITKHVGDGSNATSLYCTLNPDIKVLVNHGLCANLSSVHVDDYLAYPVVLRLDKTVPEHSVDWFYMSIRDSFDLLYNIYHKINPYGSTYAPLCASDSRCALSLRNRFLNPERRVLCEQVLAELIALEQNL